MAWEGVCAVGAAAGASCATDHCAQNLICDGRGTDDASDNVCVAEQENGAACNDAFECKSRICAAAAGATAKTCNAPTGPSLLLRRRLLRGRRGARHRRAADDGPFVAVALLRSRRTARSRR